ncbi:MAG: thiol reductant ABC exporter subunit CydD [Anaerolineae bacterium]|nr:thiol reductant ABC exporter subunit CydD [Anaerolineae bacterium]
MITRRLNQEAQKVRGLYALHLLLSAGGALVIVAQAMWISRVINAVFLGRQTLIAVGTDLLLAVVTVGVRAGLAWGTSLSAAAITIPVKTGLRARLMAHLTRLGPAYTSEARSGELVLTATEGIDALDAYFRDYLPGVVTALFVPLIILIGVFPVDLLSFVILVITAPLIPLMMILIGKSAGALARRQYQEMGRLGAHFLDVMQGLTTLKLFNRSRRQIEVIGRITHEFREATLGVLRVAFLSAFMLEMLATLSVAIVAVEIGLRLISGRVTFEGALFVLIVAPEFYAPLRLLGAKFHAGTEGAAAAERIFEILDTPLPQRSVGKSSIPADRTLRLEAVSFHYPQSAHATLTGIDLIIRQGERVALVGESGGGKSTLAALLLRFITPTQGQITLGGISLQEIALDQWRAQIGWVSQHPYLFHATVRENLLIGRPDASESALQEAVRAAGAESFIAQLPQGLDTPCGERGLRLSGGQVQRIAAARAFLRDAPFLILDEVTANLDPLNEHLIEETLRRLLRGRTALIIAHRLNTLVDVDRICVLGGGRIVEQGSHRELIALNGEYRRLWDAYHI